MPLSFASSLQDQKQVSASRAESERVNSRWATLNLMVLSLKDPFKCACSSIFGIAVQNASCSSVHRSDGDNILCYRTAKDTL